MMPMQMSPDLQRQRVPPFREAGSELLDPDTTLALGAGRTSSRCQWPSVSPQLRPSELPIGGHLFSPLVAIRSPHPWG